MQVEECGVAAGAHRVLERKHKLLEGFARRLVRRPRLGRDRRHDLGAFALRDVEVRRERRVGASEARRGRRAVRRPFAVAERLERRGDRRERVGLVLDQREDVAALHC
jgi:hypothetical protein